MVTFSVTLWNVNTDHVFASVGGMDSRGSLSNTIDEETSVGTGKSARYCPCLGLSRPSWVPHWVLPDSLHFWVLGVGIPVPHSCPRCRGHAKKTLILPNHHPQMRTDISSWESNASGLFQGLEQVVTGQEASVVSVGSSRKPLYCWRKAPNVERIKFLQLQSGYVISR